VTDGSGVNDGVSDGRTKVVGVSSTIIPALATWGASPRFGQPTANADTRIPIKPVATIKTKLQIVPTTAFNERLDFLGEISCFELDFDLLIFLYR
jgi:hypothetical protein